MNTQRIRTSDQSRHHSSTASARTVFARTASPHSTVLRRPESVRRRTQEPGRAPPELFAFMLEPTEDSRTKLRSSLITHERRRPDERSLANRGPRAPVVCLP